MEKKGEIKKRGRTYCVAGAPNNVMVIMPRYVEQFPHTKYVLSAYWLFPKRLSTQNFILLRLRSGKNKIGDIEITKDSLRKLDLHLER